jgi:hypothetical protein
MACSARIHPSIAGLATPPITSINQSLSLLITTPPSALAKPAICSAI